MLKKPITFYYAKIVFDYLCIVKKREIMDKQIIEAIPNFSEGRDINIIKYITDAMESTPMVKVLHVDMGYDANRTVITFAGEAKMMAEAAFRAIKAASETIDMSKHHGTHPRIGACDVMPLVPISGITMEQTDALAKQLSQRVATELGIPIYNYEASASKPQRTNLAECRRGEYEGLPEKITDTEWLPDFGDAEFTEQVKRSGLTVLGAREFLVAVNFNLNTEDISIAKEIAKRVRESGYIKDSKRINGSLKGVKAIGWSMDEYNITQVSTNITNINATSMHKTFDTISKEAESLGYKVTGTELIGMVPKRVMNEAIAHYFGEGIKELPYREQLSKLNEVMQFDNLFEVELYDKIIEHKL